MDQLVENELFKQMPIVKTVLGVTKTGIKIREKFFLKKVFTFIKEFNSGLFDEKELIRFKDQFNNDGIYQGKIIEELLIRIDRFDDISKAKITARLFSAYIQQKYDWQYFTQLTLSLENLHPMVFAALEQCSKDNWSLQISGWKENMDHALDSSRRIQLFGSGLAWPSLGGGHPVISQLGQDLYYFGIRSD